MDNSSGILGEKRAVKELKKKKYKIVMCNYRSRFGEIDIIAQNKEYIIFVEVKTRRIHGVTNPMDAVTSEKQRKIIKTASIFLQRYPSAKQPRFDVFAIYTDNNKVVECRHIENAFFEERGLI